MVAITIHIYNKETGEYLYQDSGTPEDIIRDLDDTKDFTTLAPPNDMPPNGVWRWVDNHWE